MKKRLLTGSVLLAFVVLGYLFWPKGNGAGGGQNMPPPGVVAAEVTSELWQDSIRISGSLYAQEDAQLRSETTGVITQILQVPGSLVEQGALLLTIGSESAEARLAGAQAELSLREHDFQRVQQLMAQKAISQSEYDGKTAQRDAAKAAVAVAKEQLSQSQVQAPFSGRLGNITWSIGDYVSPGTFLTELVNNQVLRVRYAVPERYLPKLALGQKVSVQTPAYQDRQFIGKVSFISPAVEATARAIEVEAVLENKEEVLSPGMSAVVTQLLGNSERVPMVSEDSVQTSIEGTYVYRVLEGGESGHKVEKVLVKTAFPSSGKQAILSGLKAGDRVVVKGLQKCRDGQAVEVTEIGQQQ